MIIRRLCCSSSSSFPFPVWLFSSYSSSLSCFSPYFSPSGALPSLCPFCSSPTSATMDLPSICGFRTLRSSVYAMAVSGGGIFSSDQAGERRTVTDGYVHGLWHGGNTRILLLTTLALLHLSHTRLHLQTSHWATFVSKPSRLRDENSADLHDCYFPC